MTEMSPWKKQLRTSKIWFHSEKYYQKLPFHNRPPFAKLDVTLTTGVQKCSHVLMPQPQKKTFQFCSAN